MWLGGQRGSCPAGAGAWLGGSGAARDLAEDAVAAGGGLHEALDKLSSGGMDGWMEGGREGGRKGGREGGRESDRRR